MRHFFRYDYTNTLGRVRKPKNRYPQNNLQSIVMCWGRSNQEKTVVAANFVYLLLWNLEKSQSKSMYLSQMVNELQCSPHSAHHPQVLGLGVNILVSVAVYPAILSYSRS